jgi:hypothetical protein
VIISPVAAGFVTNSSPDTQTVLANGWFNSNSFAVSNTATGQSAMKVQVDSQISGEAKYEALTSPVKVFIPFASIDPPSGDITQRIELKGGGFIPYSDIFISAPTCGVPFQKLAGKTIAPDGSIPAGTYINLAGCTLLNDPNVITVSDSDQLTDYNSKLINYHVRLAPSTPTSATISADQSSSTAAKIEVTLGNDTTNGNLPNYFEVEATNKFGAVSRYELELSKSTTSCNATDHTCTFLQDFAFAGAYYVNIRSDNEKGNSTWILVNTNFILPLNEVKSGNPFRDISSYPAKDQIIWVYHYGITSGTDSTHYSPKAKVTRGQMAKFLWALAGSPTISSSLNNPFKDISSYPAKDQIIWLYNAGITAGTDATHYSPTQSVTRGQMAKFLWALSKQSPILSNWKNPFKDIASYPAKSQIIWAYHFDITSGTDASHFSPKGTVTRGQMAKFLQSFATTGQYVN